MYVDKGTKHNILTAKNQITKWCVQNDSSFVKILMHIYTCMHLKKKQKTRIRAKMITTEYWLSLSVFLHFECLPRKASG